MARLLTKSLGRAKTSALVALAFAFSIPLAQAADTAEGATDLIGGGVTHGYRYDPGTGSYFYVNPVIAYSQLYGNKGDATGGSTSNNYPVDVGKTVYYSGYMYSGTSLMNYSTTLMTNGGAQQARNAYVVTSSISIAPETLDAVGGQTRHIVYGGPYADAVTRGKTNDESYNDLLVSGGNLSFSRVSFAMVGRDNTSGAGVGGANYLHLGSKAGSTYQYVTMKDDGTPTIDDKTKAYTLTTQTLSVGTSVDMSFDNALMYLNSGATIAMYNYSAINVANKSALIISGGLRYGDLRNGGSYTYSGDAVGAGGLGHIVDDGGGISPIRVSNESLLRITGYGSSRDAISNAGSMRVYVTGNSSMEVFNPQDLPELFIGDPIADPTLGKGSNLATIDRSRLILGTPGVYDPNNELNYRFESYANILGRGDTPDFSQFGFDSATYSVNGLAVYAGASLIAYGTLRNSDYGSGATDINRGHGITFGYQSVLMPAVSMLQFSKTVLDGTVKDAASTPNDWLNDDYRNTIAENTDGHGVGMQTVKWLYDSGGNLRNDLKSSFGPASLRITGDVTMQYGSTLMLVATGSQISKLDVTGQMIFESGSVVSVMGQSFTKDGSSVPVDVSNVTVITTGEGLFYKDDSGNLVTSLPSGFFRGYIGTTATGRIQDNNLIISVNTSLNPYSTDTGADEGSVSFANWTIGTVIPGYYNSASDTGSKISPTTYAMLNAYRAYGANPDPTKTSEDLANEAFARINPISMSYMQQQAIQVNDSIRNAVADRLSGQRPNSGVSAISTLYSEEALADMDGSREDYFTCGYKFWGRALVNYSELTPHSGESGYYGDLYGFILGAEQTLNNMTRGVSLAYAHSRNKPGEDDVQNYHGSMDSVNLSLYGSLTSAHLFIDGMAGYTYNNASDTRSVYFEKIGGLPEFWDTAEKDYDIHSVGASLRAGAMYYISEYRIMPTIGVDYNYYVRGGTNETWQSDGSAGLRYDKYHYSRLNMPLMVSLSRDFIVGQEDRWLISPEVRVGWSHQWLDDIYTFGVSYPGVGGSCDLSSISYGRNIYTVGMGLVARYDERINLVGTYDYHWQDRYRVHNINVGVDFIF